MGLDLTRTSVDTAGQRTGRLPARCTQLWLLLLGTLLLSLSVLGWGLHDKLSLYTPPNAPPVSAKAKLLSEQERPSGSAALAVTEAAVPPAASLLPTSLLLLLLSLPPAFAPAVWTRLRITPTPWPLALLPGNCERRPPPALA